MFVIDYQAINLHYTLMDEPDIVTPSHHTQQQQQQQQQHLHSGNKFS